MASHCQFQFLRLWDGTDDEARVGQDRNESVIEEQALCLGFPEWHNADLLHGKCLFTD